ncbi:MAG: hypothetical protein JOZ41_21005 [Chloroflexi bacterium]|nr:hypothetical protein [Chloroflexota bacterium]
MTCATVRRITYRAVLGTAALLVPLPASAAPQPDPLASSGGAVMQTSTTYALFWLPSGAHYEPAGSDTSYESLTQRFLSDVGGTAFYNILTQYPDGAGNAPANTSSFGGSYVDGTPYPHAGTAADALLDSDVQTEVARVVATQGWTADLNHVVLVYTGNNIQTCLDGPAGTCTSDTFCAYHSWFIPSGGTQPTLYATLPVAGENGGGCLAQGTSGTYPNSDAIGDSEVSLTSKELFGAVSDPQGDGWTDSTGAEVGDKCNWTFGTAAGDGSNVVLHGHPYLVQQEWSNASSSCSLGMAMTQRSARPSGASGVTGGTTATPVPGQSTRLTPTPTPSGAATATPTPVSGRGHR